MSGVSPWALADHDFLRGLPSDTVTRLAALAAEISFPAGHRLFEEGGMAGQFWLIRTGRVALDLKVPGPAPLIVETIGDGDVIGLSWLAQRRRWQFGAEAVYPTTAFEFDSAAVSELMDRDSALGYQLARRLIDVATRRLQATRFRLLDMYGLPRPHADAI